MQCPACKEELSVPSIAISNLLRNRKAITVRTRCCGYGVRLLPKKEYEVRALTKPETHDAFGQQLRQKR